jgi:hypothetical protein
MNKNDFSKEWENIWRMSLVDLYNFQDLEDLDDITNNFYATISNIFITLQRLKMNKVYNHKEIETIYVMIKDYLYYINDLLIQVNSKGLPALVYEVIFNIFEELVLLCEDNELFEACQNLLNIRDYWFSQFGVKIMNVKSGQK